MNQTKPETWTPERCARAALSYIVMPGDGRLNNLVDEEGATEVVASLKRLDDDSAWGMRAAAVDVNQMVELATSLHMRFVIPGDEEWPLQLNDLDECQSVGQMRGRPFGLWVIGPARLDEITKNSIAIVGSRAATRYGARLATEIAAELARNEYNCLTIVSGGAYGIDAAAHRGGLAAGATIGVYAGGLDECYPKSNLPIFTKMATQFAVCSEVPPRVRQNRRGFLARNRLIAGLANAVLVIEAASRSGALNTANWADSLGRLVMAMPGSVDSSMSVGCHRLIRDSRATLVTCADDVQALVNRLGVFPDLPDGGPQRPLDMLPSDLMLVREALPAHGRITPEQVAIKCGMPMSITMSRLAELSMSGHADVDDAGRWGLAAARKLPAYFDPDARIHG